MLESKSTEKVLLYCPKCNEEFPAQGRERYVHIVDTIRENQEDVCTLLLYLDENPDMMRAAKDVLDGFNKMDRDAILQPGGILTDEQIELLK